MKLNVALPKVPKRKKKVNIRDIDTNMVLSDNMYISLNQKKHKTALNTLISGTTGSGKSRFVLKPNLLQMNCSYVVTDPSGGILQECGEALRRFGYNVRVFNIKDMGDCNTYNPLKYCYKESDIKKIVQAFIKNTDSSGGKGGGNKDPFWDDSMNAFMCACISFLVTCPKGEDRPYGMIPEITGGKVFPANFATLTELTRMANTKNPRGGEGVRPYNDKVESRLGDGKNNTAGASKLAVIYENLRAYEADKQGVSVDSTAFEKPYTLREWENFKIAPEKTSTTILMTAAVRLDAFNIEQVKNLTSTDTICLDTFGEGRDVLFLIIPTNDRTYNFLVSFIYTQLFDILYSKGETQMEGSYHLKMQNGELVRHFPSFADYRKTKEYKEHPLKDEQEYKSHIEEVITKIKKATFKQYHYEREAEKDEEGNVTGYTLVEKEGSLVKHGKAKGKSTSFDDSWFNIYDADNNVISRRPDARLAEKYVADLQNAKLVPGKHYELPYHVACLMDEFPNIGEVPEFKEKLATVRKYEINCVVICQSITQLKGMYPDDYQVIDANCPIFIFLGGTENDNNDYISKKLGNATVKGGSNSIDGGGVNSKSNNSVQADQRPLMSADELGRKPYMDELVIISGEKPLYDKKYDYPKHKNYKYTNDYCKDIGIEDGSVFDCACFVIPEVNTEVRKAIIPEAVPEIHEAEEEDFITSIGCLSALDAIDHIADGDTDFEDDEDWDDEDFSENSAEGFYD